MNKRGRVRRAYFDRIERENLSGPEGMLFRTILLRDYKVPCYYMESASPITRIWTNIYERSTGATYGTWHELVQSHLIELQEYKDAIHRVSAYVKFQLTNSGQRFLGQTTLRFNRLLLEAAHKADEAEAVFISATEDEVLGHNGMLRYIRLR